VRGGLFEYTVELAASNADRNHPFFAVVVEGQTRAGGEFVIPSTRFFAWFKCSENGKTFGTRLQTPSRLRCLSTSYNLFDVLPSLRDIQNIGAFTTAVIRETETRKLRMDMECMLAN
jgi:hypothetical protein